MDSVGDEAVIATNDDAAICKYQAVSRGYYQDPFLEQFISSKAKSTSLRKTPEINLGYYARSASVAYLVEQFIINHPSAQIISLGAGYDSLYWRLKKSKFLQSDADLESQFKYVEIDMSVVSVHKIMAIRRHPDLSKMLSGVSHKGEDLHSDQYNLISFDLRQVDKTSLRRRLIDECKIDLTRPTLCLAECVLVYMPNQDSHSLINWFANNFPHLTMINYEQCNMVDRFGDIMVANMNARHCDLMGVDACKSLDSQVNRFHLNGLTHTEAWTLLDIYKSCLLPSEVDRIESIEFFDEKELLEQLLQHYCIVLGSNKPIDWLPKDQYWLSKTLSFSS